MYRTYVADTLWGIANGKSFHLRINELLNPQPEETRTADEIIEHVKEALERGGSKFDELV